MPWGSLVAPCGVSSDTEVVSTTAAVAEATPKPILALVPERATVVRPLSTFTANQRALVKALLRQQRPAALTGTAVPSTRAA